MRPSFPGGPANGICPANPADYVPLFGVFLTPGAPNEPNDANSPGNPTPSPIGVVGPRGVLVPTYAPVYPMGALLTLVVNGTPPQSITTISSDPSIADGDNLFVSPQ